VGKANGILGKVQQGVYLAFGYAPGLQREIEKLHPSLIHAHFGIDGVSALPLAETLKLPLIVTFHGYDATTADVFAGRSFPRHRLYILRRRELQQKGALFIAVSQFIKERIIAQGFPSERVVVHHIGIDVERFKPVEPAKRQSFVLFVARLVEVKGCEYLIQAMVKVQAKHPNAELVIIGDGSLRPHLENLAKVCAIRHRFLGWCSPEQVADWLSKSKVFCMPSVVGPKGEREGLSNVCLESQSTGLPVVGFSSGGIPEAVAHGETGFLAPEKDADTLAAHIMTLLENPDLWHQFSQRAIERTRALFDIRRQTCQLETLYDAVVAEHAQRASDG
jgi:glycosyltransferase involved in cell wall biosynthesis